MSPVPLLQSGSAACVASQVTVINCHCGYVPLDLFVLYPLPLSKLLSLGKSYLNLCLSLSSLVINMQKRISHLSFPVMCIFIIRMLLFIYRMTHKNKKPALSTHN